MSQHSPPTPPPGGCLFLDPDMDVVIDHNGRRLVSHDPLWLGSVTMKWMTQPLRGMYTSRSASALCHLPKVLVTRA